MIANQAGTLFTKNDDPISHLQAMDMVNLVRNAYLWRRDIHTTGDGRRDYDKECGYPDPNSLTVMHYKKMYDVNPIAARANDLFGDESWQSPPEIYESEDENEETEFERRWSELATKLRGEKSWFKPDNESHPVWEILKRVDKQSGIGHFGIVLIGIDDGKTLDQPIDGFTDPEPDATPTQRRQMYIANQEALKKRGERNLLYLSVFNESLVQTVEFDGDVYSPRFNRPKYYTVTIGNAATGYYSTSSALQTGTQTKVHWSRVIHVAETLESSEVIAIPRLRHIYNQCLDLIKVFGAAGEGYWKGSFPGMSFETHPQLGGDVVVDDAALQQQTWDYFNGLQRAFRLTGMSAKSLSTQVVDPTPQINAIIEAICIYLGVPVRIFKGSERGELASGQDDSTWNDRLRLRKRGYITPRIIVPFVDRLIQIGVLPEPKQFQVHWEDPEALKPQEKAEIASKRVETMAKYLAGRVHELMDPMDFMTREMGLTNNEATQVLENAIAHTEEKDEEALEKREEQMKLQQKMVPTPPANGRAPLFPAKPAAAK